jgi:hypothetical protein
VSRLNRAGIQPAQCLASLVEWIQLQFCSVVCFFLTCRRESPLSSCECINSTVFDPDYNSASLSPGFKLGLPKLAGPYLNTQSNKNCYQLLLPSGRVVELRQLSTSTYESGDSTFTRLMIDTSQTVF